MNESATNLATDTGCGQVPEIHFKSAGRSSESGSTRRREESGKRLRNHFLCLETSLRVDKQIDEINSSRLISLRRKEQTPR